MSVVTNVILAFDICDDDERVEILDIINGLVIDSCCSVCQGFVHVADAGDVVGWYGGSKYLETNIAIAAFNHLRLGEFIEKLKTIDFSNWDLDYVQLIVQCQDNQGFGIIDIYKGKGFGPFIWQEWSRENTSA